MKGRLAVLVAAAVAVVVLVIPATGQGKVPPLYWTQVHGGGPAITSYDYGFVRQYSATWFRLGGTDLPKSGKLKITLKGSPAFSIVENRCKGKSIGGPLLSCWVEVAYTPFGLDANDSAVLTAKGLAVRPPAHLKLTGRSPGGCQAPKHASRHRSAC